MEWKSEDSKDGGVVEVKVFWLIVLMLGAVETFKKATMRGDWEKATTILYSIHKSYLPNEFAIQEFAKTQPSMANALKTLEAIFEGEF